MRKLLACLALSIFMAGILSGCWSRRELGELAFVLGAGVDRTPDGQVQLTLQLARPGALAGAGGEGGGGRGATTWVVSEKGTTILDAQRKLAMRISRHINWTHNVILVFGEEAARHGVRQYTNFFSRSPQSRETAWMFVARGEAKEILETSSQLVNTSAQDIGFLALARTGYSVNFKDFKIMLATGGSNPIASRVEIVERGVTLGPEQEAARHKGAALAGTAVFRDEKLAGWLDESETRGLLWLRGEILKGVITFPSLTDPGKEMSVEIVRGYTEVEPYYDGETVWFTVKIIMEGDLVEQQSTEDILERDVRKAIEETIAREVEEKLRLALDKAQGEYGVDAFDFGTAFRRKYPGAWAELKDRWDEVFAGSYVEFEMQAHLRRSGLLGIRGTIKK